MKHLQTPFVQHELSTGYLWDQLGQLPLTTHYPRFKLRTVAAQKGPLAVDTNPDAQCPPDEGGPDDPPQVVCVRVRLSVVVCSALCVCVCTGVSEVPY